jgi:hypothetical protein
LAKHLHWASTQQVLASNCISSLLFLNEIIIVYYRNRTRELSGTRVGHAVVSPSGTWRASRQMRRMREVTGWIRTRKPFILTNISRSVSKATGWTAGVRFSSGTRFFSSSQCPDWLWGPPSVLFYRYKGLFLPGVNLTTHFHPLFTGVKYTRGFPCTLHTPPWGGV